MCLWALLLFRRSDQGVLTILRVMVMLLAVLVAGIAYSEVHPNVKTADPKEAPKDEQRGSDNSPISVKIIPAPDAEAKAAKEERYRQAHK